MTDPIATKITVALTTEQWVMVTSTLDTIAEAVSDPRYRWLSDHIADQVTTELSA